MFMGCGAPIVFTNRICPKIGMCAACCPPGLLLSDIIADCIAFGVQLSVEAEPEFTRCMTGCGAASVFTSSIFPQLDMCAACCFQQLSLSDIIADCVPHPTEC
jgi:hypothetical protein